MSDLPPLFESDDQGLSTQAPSTAPLRSTPWLMVALLGYGFFTFIYLVLIAGSFATGRLDALPLFAAAAIVGIATMVATARQSRFANWLAGAFVALESDCLARLLQRHE